MADLSFTATAGLSVNGISKATGIPTSVLKGTGTFAPGAVDASDTIEKTFVVNASTTKTAIDIDKITAGKLLWVETDKAVEVYVTQDFGVGPVEGKFYVSKFLLLQSAYSAVAVANTGGTAANISVMAVGDKPVVGTGPGVF